MDGPTATKLIREAGYKGLIVGVTGNVLPEDKAYFLSQGADAVMTKPLDMKELKQLLDDYSGGNCKVGPSLHQLNVHADYDSVGASISSGESSPQTAFRSPP
jgi:CheY-like chemotaxis protein